MERTTHWAALYFVLLMTFGNYVLFNLLVAILVEGFSKQDELFDASQAKGMDHQNSIEESEKKMNKIPEKNGVKIDVSEQEDSDVEAVYTKSNAVKEEMRRKSNISNNLVVATNSRRRRFTKKEYQSLSRKAEVFGKKARILRTNSSGR